VSLLLLFAGGAIVAPSNPPVVPPTDAELLDLAFGVRVSGFKYELLDAANQPVGEVEIDVTEGHPRISNNINRTIKRTMDGLVLPPETQAEINPLVHRIRPRMILSNGGTFPLGVFLFADLAAEVYSFGDFGHGSMVDQGLILDQPSSTGAGYAPGTLVADAIAAEFTKAGLTTWVIDPTVTAVIGAAVAWPAGTNRSTICAELCALGGAYSPYFDNAGTITVRKVDDLATATPDLLYYTDQRSRIFASSTTISNDAMDAPNQYIVIDGSAADSAIVGVYDIPNTAPHSEAQRGFVVAQVIRADGLESVEAAVARAQAEYGSGGGAAFEHVQFASPPDPRHDTFQIVAYDDINYREQEWSMQLRDGTDMTHHLRRSYAPNVIGGVA
jgi:hypothetical protein